MDVLRQKHPLKLKREQNVLVKISWWKHPILILPCHHLSYFTSSLMVFWAPWWLFWDAKWLTVLMGTFSQHDSDVSCRCEIQRSLRRRSSCESTTIFYANATTGEELPRMVQLLNALLTEGIITHSRLRRRWLLCSFFLNWLNQGVIHLRSPELQTAVGECHNFAGGWQEANCMTARRFPTLKPMEQQTGPLLFCGQSMVAPKHAPGKIISGLQKMLLHVLQKTEQKKLTVPLLLVAEIYSAAVQ